MNLSEYFEEQYDNSCQTCEFRDQCNHINYTGGVYLDPFCACVTKEELEMDIDDFIEQNYDQLLKEQKLKYKEDEEVEKLRLKKELTQERRRATLFKNREVNKQRHLERREKQVLENIKRLQETFKTLGDWDL